MTFHFSKTYFLLAVLLFAVEVCIALFYTDQFIRPFLGDALVVCLIYCSVRTFIQNDSRKISCAVLIFACVIEILQYFDYVKLLGLENNRAISVIMGRTFEWLDFAAYFAGFLLILIFEKMRQNK